MDVKVFIHARLYWEIMEHAHSLNMSMFDFLIKTYKCEILSLGYGEMEVLFDSDYYTLFILRWS